MAKKQNRSDVQPYRYTAVLANEDIELLMQALIRKQDAFVAVREMLKPEDLAPFSPQFAMLWEVLQEYYSEHDELPDYLTLKSALRGHWRTEPGKLDPQDLRDLYIFCRRAWKLKSDKVNLKWAIKTTRKYLEEQLADTVRQRLGQDNQRLIGLPEMLRDCQIKSEAIASLHGDSSDLAYPIDWEPKPLGVVTTGIDFLDELMGGGHAPGECYLFVGPTGSCKTTTMLQLASEAVLRAFIALTSGMTSKIGLVYVISYETAIEELRYRMMCCHAQIERGMFEKQDKNHVFSTARNPKLYEKRIFKAELSQPGAFKGEAERMRDAMKELNKHLRWIDCSGSDMQHPNRGGGGVPEIASIIRNDLRTIKDSKVDLIVVDWAGDMLHKYVTANNIDPGQIRYLLSKLPGELRTQLGLQFNCPVWLTHQMAGAMNNKSPGARFSHTDAENCKTMGNNCSFAFSVGSQDLDSHCVLRCSKFRRQPTHPSQIIKIDGALGTVRGVNGAYVLDEGKRTIVHKSQLLKKKKDSAKGNQGMPPKVTPIGISPVET